MSRFSLNNFFLPKILLDWNLTKSTTTPEYLTDDELLLSTLCHMTSQIKDNGKESRVTEVCIMENKTDDELKARFLVVRKEIFNRYTTKK
jgi:hypothetical protein